MQLFVKERTLSRKILSKTFCQRIKSKPATCLLIIKFLHRIFNWTKNNFHFTGIIFFLILLNLKNNIFSLK